jgi:hypothetical protein
VQGGFQRHPLVAGVIGGNVAGWVSDLFFQSRRGPAAGGLYAFMSLLVVVMIFVLAPPTNKVSWADEKSGLRADDELVAIAGKEVSGWADIRSAVACWAPKSCEKSQWDAEACICSTKAAAGAALNQGVIPAKVVRGGQSMEIELPDPSPVQRAGDQRTLKARPVLPISPFMLGVCVFLISLCVIGTHGLLSGTATIDFAGARPRPPAGSSTALSTWARGCSRSPSASSPPRAGRTGHRS